MAYLTTDDTIAAIASPTGSGQRGILRISGPGVAQVVADSFAFDGETDLNSIGRATRFTGSLKLAENRLPCTLLFWPDSRSYTRQPSAEFHTLGSTPLLEMALSKLCSSGARLAEPGEFTLRAFLSGRMDLTQAEAVLAVIDAESGKKLSVALEQLSGGLAGPLADTKRTLMNVLAELEAGLDFVEEDIEFIASEQIVSALSDGLKQVQQIERQISERGSDGQEFKVVLSGLPNAGKSSLFNSLLESEQAIVTDIAGTTTDFVTATTKMEGVLVQLIDTAGLESTDDYDIVDDSSSSEIMETAQRKRSAEIEGADLVLLCAAPDNVSQRWAIGQMAKLKENGREFLLILTKSDLFTEFGEAPQSLATPSSYDTTAARIDLQRQVTRITGSQRKLISVSSHTGESLDRLKFEISATAIANSTGENAIVGSTLLRTRESLKLAAVSIGSALEAAEGEFGQEIVAAEIRESLDAIGQIVGTVYNDDVLDLVFGRFCIGK